MGKLIIIDDDATTLELLTRLCRKAGHEVQSFGCGERALEAIKAGPLDLLIADLHLKRSSGLQVVHQAAERHPGLPVIMITANDTLEAAAAAMRLGVYDFLTKPFKPTQLIQSIGKALKTLEVGQPKPDASAKTSCHSIASSNSTSMQRCLNVMERLIPLGCPILLQGEFGVGKRSVAQWIHQESQHGDPTATFIEIACVKANEELLMRTFEEGTGSPCTVYLCEVENLNERSQAMLNHLLDERMARRSAWSQTTESQCRIVASSCLDLEQHTRLGRFREDLFYKLAVIPIRIPPLRERVEELPDLVHQELIRICRGTGREKPPQLTPESMSLVTTYNWPGNLAELRNALERSCILCEGDLIKPDHLPTKLGLPAAFAPRMSWSSTYPVGMSLHCFLKQQEHLFILETLKHFVGARERACSTLGISAATLYRKTGIRRERGRDARASFNPLQPHSEPGACGED
jgi:DNA-binding NtrC family response regulator